MASPNVRVNLLSDRKRLLKDRKVLVAKLQLFAGVVLAIYVAVLLVVIGFRTTVSARLEKAEEGIKNETFKITQLNQREALYTVLENKVSLAGDFLGNRISLKDEFQRVVDMLPEGAYLNKFSMSDDNNSVTLGIVAEDMYVVVLLLNEFELQIEDNEYEYIMVQSLSRSADGTYNIAGEVPI